MTDTAGVGSADSVGRSEGVAGDDGGVSETEAAGLAEEAVDTGDDDAAAVAEQVAGATPTDTFEAIDGVPTEPAVTEVEEEVEEPGVVESVATWAGETLKGYGTGAINGVLDMANVVNMGANGLLDAVGVDYRFETEMGIAPTSEAERNAQNAITVASAVAGGVGMVRSAPAIGRALATGIDDVADIARAGFGGSRNAELPAAPIAGAPSVASAARLGDLRPDEIARIQAAADELGADLYVLGSAARGTRRGVGSDLPLAEFGGTKAGTRSDIDYVVRNGLDDAADALGLPDVDSSWGVRGVDYINLDSSPAIRFSPGRMPEFLEGGGRINLD